MAQDDMFVVMYKIIAYLYNCMKRGEAPDNSRISAVALGISEPYWTQIIAQMIDHNLLSGVKVLNFDNISNVVMTSPKVTMEGVQFAQENSMMAKAAKFLRDAKASIPFI